jgi:hypothetical protein
MNTVISLKHLIVFSIILSMTFWLAPSVNAFRIDNFVRSGNQYLVAGPDLQDSDWPELSRFDLIVLPAEAQNFNPTVAQELRLRNPDIIILAYVPTVSYNDRYWTDELHLKLQRTLTPSMELNNRYGEQISIWPETRAYNVANAEYRQSLATYIEDHVYSSGYWDGIFLDEVSSSISWVGTTDIYQAGQQDNSIQADTAWKNGYTHLFSDLRSRLGDDALLITNGSSEEEFQSSVNGRMFESFPTPWEGRGLWEDIMRLLLLNQQAVKTPEIFFINSNTGNTGIVDYKQMRYGLTSAMLGGAFFGYDFGEVSHSQLWIFDEFETYLGRVVDAPKDELNGRSSLSSTDIYPSVWSREFQEGRIIVNATDEAHTVKLEKDFEKINGSQDRSVNNGRIVSEVTVGPRDGIVLVRPLEELLNNQFPNGSFVRLFDLQGNRKRSGFFAYTGATFGGEQIVRSDLDGNGSVEIVSANDSLIRIHDAAGRVTSTFHPYGEAYGSGINLAIGDLDNDGFTEIVTGTKNGGGPHIRIFNRDGVLINPGFFAYGEGYRGGVNIALGDLNGDGQMEIIAGAGVGGGPHVRIFNKDGHLVNPGFFAFDENFRGGVNVAAGDVTGDGQIDIITGPGNGGKPTVRVFNDRGVQLIEEFDAFNSRQRNGVKVAAEDLDGDGVSEIMALTTDVFTLSGQ